MEEKSRVALVTGASRGIGACVASTLAELGYQVAGISGSGKAPDKVLGLACDITDPNQVEAAIKQVENLLGPVEVLVANAGVTRDTLALRMSEDDWAKVIDVNLTGTYRVIKRVLRPMLKARFGRIVLMGSVVAMLGSPGQINYAASKAGLIGLARSLSREIAGRGITVNVIAPGFIDTDMTADLSEEVRADYAKRIPAGRFGQVEDVANAVKFLAADESSYITGAVIPVDGGIGMGH
uniref:3-oxoacyl-[acyl-carrier-protein] reductase n=1 Tax=Vaginimicrobium propionicum TaxID=1871034 RepID=UPI00097147AD|nr:3-oxoacyl-[acyl-carrier-protein] reductase [Vaginimicrobium propionicum]